MTMEPETYLYLDDYFHLEGFAYRILPVRADPKDGQPGDVNTDLMYDHVMNRFKWGNMNDPRVNLDEQNQRMIMNFRNMFGRLANYLILENKTDSARKVLDRCLEVMPVGRGRVNFFLLPLAEGYYKIHETKKGNLISEAVYKAMQEDLSYMFSFPRADLKTMDTALQEDLMTLNQIYKITTDCNERALAKKSYDCFQKYYQEYMNKVYTE